ncbi:MAG: hypothetical protein IJW99_12005 [Clostridia bacterium]|nr:hypothetical protein [Clostridia bacterium]
MKANMKRIGLSAALLLLTALLCGCASAPAPQSIEPIKESAFITLDINPGIELVIDGNHKVISVHAANLDGEILLFQEEELIGADVHDAIARITALAVEMGYLDGENAAVSVTVTTKTGETEDELYTAIEETIAQATEQAGLELRVEEAVDLVLSKELARVKAENADKRGYDDSLTLSRFRLVKAAMRADRELTMDRAVLMTNDALTATVNAAKEEAETKFTSAYEVARDEAVFAYENARQTLLDSAYTAIYTARRDLSSILGNHGATYAAYRLAYRSVEHYSETMRRLIENPIFTSDDVFALANALGIDTSVEAEYEAFRKEISDEEGNVTKESVNAYINRVYKNMEPEDRAALESAYDKVLVMFDRLQADASVIREDGLTSITAALMGMQFSVTVKTYEDLDDLLAAIQRKIDDTCARMEEDLTENEKARVEEMQEEMNTKLAEYEKAYKDAMRAAKEKADAYLEAQKEARTDS